jgi:hypothetical protein
VHVVGSPTRKPLISGLHAGLTEIKVRRCRAERYAKMWYACKKVRE